MGALSRDGHSFAGLCLVCDDCGTPAGAAQGETPKTGILDAGAALLEAIRCGFAIDATPPHAALCKPCREKRAGRERFMLILGGKS